jgi:predicted transcriptional regulator YheO
MENGDTSTILEIEAKLESLIRILKENKVIDEKEFKETYEDMEIEVMKKALKKLNKAKTVKEEPTTDKKAIVTSLERLKNQMEEMRLKSEVEKLQKKHNP